MEILTGAIGLFAGSGVATLAMAALSARNYRERYDNGYAAGYDQGTTDSANKATWMVESVRTIQIANRKLNEERAQRNVELGHLAAELNWFRTDNDLLGHANAELRRDNSLLTRANAELHQSCVEQAEVIAALSEATRRAAEAKP